MTWWVVCCLDLCIRNFLPILTHAHVLLIVYSFSLLTVNPCVFRLDTINVLHPFLPQADKPSVCRLPTLVLQRYYLRGFSDVLSDSDGCSYVLVQITKGKVAGTVGRMAGHVTVQWVVLLTSTSFLLFHLKWEKRATQRGAFGAICCQKLFMLSALGHISAPIALQSFDWIFRLGLNLTVEVVTLWDVVFFSRLWKLLLIFQKELENFGWKKSAWTY